MERLQELGGKPEGETSRNLSDILNANLDKIATRAPVEKASERKVKPDSEEKPSKEPVKGKPDDAHSDEGKKPEPKPKAATEPGKPAKAESDADKPFAPKTWSEEERKAFEASPPEVQQAVNKLVKNLQSGFTKKTMALADDQRLASEIRGALKPQHADLFKRHGMTEGQGIQRLLSLYDSATADPVSFVKRMIASSRIPLEALGIAAPQGGAQPAPANPGQPVDPQVARLQEQLNAITGVLNQAHARSAQTAQQKQAAAEQDAHGFIVNFINEIDDTGMPAHPHWETVQNHVLMIAKNDPDIAELPPREKLAAAYERAVYANPAARAAMLEAERAKTTAQVERERSRSALSKKPSGSSGGVKQAKRSLDQIIRNRAKKYDEL